MLPLKCTQAFLSLLTTQLDGTPYDYLHAVIITYLSTTECQDPRNTSHSITILSFNVLLNMNLSFPLIPSTMPFL